MKTRLSRAKTFVISALLHAVLVGFVLWQFDDDAKAEPLHTFVVFNEPFVRAAAVTTRTRPVLTKRAVQTSQASDASAQNIKSDSDAAPTDAPSPSSTSESSNVYDLTAAPSHPYFGQLRRMLSQAMRDLSSAADRPEEFSIRIGIESTGQISKIRIDGEDSRLKEALAERLAGLAFLPNLPADILVQNPRIEIKYRALFR